MLQLLFGVNDSLTPTGQRRRRQKMVSMPAVVDGKGQEHCKRCQRARLRRLVVDENAQQHRPYNGLAKYWHSVNRGPQEHNMDMLWSCGPLLKECQYLASFSLLGYGPVVLSWESVLLKIFYS